MLKITVNETGDQYDLPGWAAHLDHTDVAVVFHRSQGMAMKFFPLPEVPTEAGVVEAVRDRKEADPREAFLTDSDGKQRDSAEEYRSYSGVSYALMPASRDVLEFELHLHPDISMVDVHAHSHTHTDTLSMRLVPPASHEEA